MTATQVREVMQAEEFRFYGVMYHESDIGKRWKSVPKDGVVTIVLPWQQECVLEDETFITLIPSIEDAEDIIENESWYAETLRLVGFDDYEIVDDFVETQNYYEYGII